MRLRREKCATTEWSAMDVTATFGANPMPLPIRTRRGAGGYSRECTGNNEREGTNSMRHTSGASTAGPGRSKRVRTKIMPGTRSCIGIFGKRPAQGNTARRKDTLATCDRRDTWNAMHRTPTTCTTGRRMAEAVMDTAGSV